MVTLSSQAQLLRALDRAKEVTLVAYLLPRGAVFDALAAAARRGARVTVRLEGKPYYDARGGVHRLNRSAVAELTRAGADARLVDEDGVGPSLHAKAAVVDGALYLDDVNFSHGASGTILRDSTPTDAQMLRDAIDRRSDPPSTTFALRKSDALTLEAALLARARANADVVVESESIGTGSAIYSKLERLGRAGCAPRLLVSRQALSDEEHRVLAHLSASGVGVRVCNSNEKFALTGNRAWVGSANATSSYYDGDQLDWGVRTRNTSIVAELRTRFESRWSQARPFCLPSG